MLDKPSIDHILTRSKEVPRSSRPYLSPNYVIEPTWRWTNNLLCKFSLDQLSSLNHDDFVLNRCIVCPFASILRTDFESGSPILSGHVDIGDDQRHDLLSSPEGLRLDDCGHGQLVHCELCLGPFKTHAQIHYRFFVDEIVLLGEEHHTQQRVLHNTHNRFVRLRGNDLVRHCHNFFDFGNGFVALWHKHIHFVTIKIGVVGWSDGQVETEGWKG